MNKKRLSVVMAGAMLASSVAPVMAAETTTEVQKNEHSANELGLLQEEIRDLVEQNRFADEDDNAPAGEKDVRNQSIYSVYINNVLNENLVAGASTQTWQNVFNSLRVGDTVEVYDRGHKVVDGKNYHYEVKTDYPRYDKAGLAELKTELEKVAGTEGVVNKVTEDTKGNLVVVLNDAVTIPGQESIKSTLPIELGSKKIELKDASITPPGNDVASRVRIYRDAAHKVEANLFKSTKPEDFYGFVYEKKESKTTAITGKTEKLYSITPGGYNFDVTDLYDGLFLTEKGNEFFGMLKDNVAADRKITIAIKDNKNGRDGILKEVKRYSESDIKSLEETFKGSLKADEKGNYRFEVRLAAKGQLKAEKYTVSGKDLSNIARLASWMLRPQARVDKFEGSNRYETAALLAREYAGLTRDTTFTKGNDIVKGSVNLVLVNGRALVDGLAAAPLAATKTNYVRVNDKTNEWKHVTAPVLLTEADKLPKETKAYLKEVLSNVTVGDLSKVTIHLVGGETVLSKDLERDLKALGFKGFNVKRYDGANREETSLAVAEEVADGNRAFVVGGEGEADAMSIASVAATQKTPIIVAKKGGISEDAVYSVRDKDVTIVGGKTVVTSAEEKEIRLEAKSVNRVFGSNRKATNAEVIKRYYNEAGFANGVGNAQNVIVAKDGQRNNMELVDALAAANMAATKKAPIVLATDKLSKEQETAIKSYANNAYGLFQVGGQVNKEVVRTIAKMLNLTNR